MEKSQKALPPQVRAWVEARKQYRLSRAGADGPRTRAEPGKARQDQQPPARAVEGAAAAVHRVPLPQAVWPGTAPGRHSGGEVGAVGGGEETGAECCRHERPR